MAFLDNSGDIILDAVLTDLGRKRMAEGTFRITQFALGDDEIDYRIYDKNHPSGSAYYDLQILQTPVLEAFASSNANINHGLVSFNGNLNLLYLPTMKVWNKSTAVNEGSQIQMPSGSSYLLAATEGTATALQAALAADATIGDAAVKYYQHPANDATVVLLETGIHSVGAANPPKDTALNNRGTYIVEKGLLDSNFDVSVDNRFIGAVHYNAGTSKWNVQDGEVSPDCSLAKPTFTEIPAGGLGGSVGIPSYLTAIVEGIDSLVAATPTDPVRQTNFSMINGPSGRLVSLSFSPGANMDQQLKYAQFGRTGQDLFGDSNTYDYLDTKVYVVGKTTGVTAHIPVRIIRLVT